ncbi:MAG: DUF2520 domain-containing protein [Planctomycetota bacterium]
MALRIAIVGPGRVGTAFGRGFRIGGAHVLGYVGRSERRLQHALAALGDGRALTWSDLATAHVVVFAVGDGDLSTAVQSAVDAGAVRTCALWLHTSGRHDLDVLACAERAGARIGSLHPPLPFPAAGVGDPDLCGQPAVVAGPAKSLRLLQRLCALLKLDPIVCSEQDRSVYHAACALLANGSTALFGVGLDLLAAAGGMQEVDRRRVAAALMGAAASHSQSAGPIAALSGPVQRGDAASVAEHLRALGARSPSHLDFYRAVMLQVLELARAGGLAQDRCEGIERALSCRQEGERS